MATLLLDVETGHNEMIHDAQLDYYAKKLATCSSDTTIKVYDIHSDQQWQHQSDLKGHDGPVWQVAWAHPKFGVVLASCSFDGKVIIHREQPAGQWQKIFVFHEFQSSANSIAWAPHEYDLCLACVSSDGQLCVLSHNSDDSWSVSRARVPNGLGLNAVSWAPYGVNQGRERRLVTGGCDNTVRIWCCTEENGQLSEWREEHQFDNEHNDWVRDVAWAPSIGLPCNTIASCSEDGKVVVWTQPDLSSNRWDKVVVRDTNGTAVWRVSWSITGSVLAISAGDSDVTLWKESLDGTNWVQISDVNEDTFAQSQPALDDQQQQPQQDYQQQDYQQPDYQQQDYQQQDYQQQGSQQPHQDQGSFGGQQDFYGNYAQQGAPQQQFGHNPPAPPSGMQQGQQFGQPQFQQQPHQQAPSGFGGYPPQQGGQQQPPQMGFQHGPPGGAPSQGFQQPPMNNGMPPQQQQPPPPHQGMYQQGMY